MNTNRINKITIDESVNRSLEARHERDVAIADLKDDNSFQPFCMKGGPYDVHLSIADGRLVFDIVSQTGEKAQAVLSIKPMRGLIRDYFMICESYYTALKENPSKIEAIDMGRRGIHNEGSEKLQEVLKGRILVDFATARRLFTLICVLHIK